MKNLLFLILTCTIIYSCNNPQKSPAKTNEDKVANTKAPTDDVLDKKKAAPTPDKNVKLQGIDISSYQTDIDWDKVKGDDISFVIVKATGGETYVDPLYYKHWKDVNEAGIMRGAYHFYYTKDDPVTQAKFYISKVLPLTDKGDLPPIIDIETDGVNTKITKTQLQEDIKTFLGVIEKAFERKPILYTSHAFAQEYFDNPDFSNYYLWLAEYGVDQPPVPNGWKEAGWTFWQNSESTTVSGIKGVVDHDFFNGSIEKLKSL